MTPPLVHLTPLDPDYPSRLRGLPFAPASLTTRGGSLEADRVVAVIGSRDASRSGVVFARALARALVRVGVVVASGGALGIDAAAHKGALAAGGRTWAVAGTGCDRCYPPEHAALFERIARGPGAMLWPFPRERHRAFIARNRLLVALSDAVVVAQANRVPSGALSAAECARKQGKPLWVVPAPPWLRGFDGSRRLLDQGARPLTNTEAFIATLWPAAAPSGGADRAGAAAAATVATGSSVASAAGARPLRSRPSARAATGAAVAPAGPAADLDPRPWSEENLRPWSDEEEAVWNAISGTPFHLDQIALDAHVTVQAAAAALLTLALDAVVVEGPPGFYRRRNREKS
ncbi:MAG TPA: DNA-processing protein DprA [Polyangiaceae bacterium]|nr:DNA-processing protein DprA [Polyangiaceae bacterium]